MAVRELRLHACREGGFIVFGPDDEAQAFQRGDTLRPQAAFNTLGEMLGYVQKVMSPEPKPALAGATPAPRAPLSEGGSVFGMGPL